jgi:hypothetical protein
MGPATTGVVGHVCLHLSSINIRRTIAIVNRPDSPASDLCYDLARMSRTDR